ncbi:hypothetical protein PACTADRAFT_4498 [Pachysolen tannophilus NRRL Y-2460]|uniref:Uncharacterized protein n=1 Tax=Pachysolen tannophilus NRRL Y-2460 TaxID=669874 RepID=A0A1E4TPA6_PACTA|nr:hypothetical protein PACTADRAFT_4498 [Pachysolen tannophilus NRRL Y-2460]
MAAWGAASGGIAHNDLKIDEQSDYNDLSKDLENGKEKEFVFDLDFPSRNDLEEDPNQNEDFIHDRLADLANIKMNFSKDDDNNNNNNNDDDDDDYDDSNNSNNKNLNFFAKHEVLFKFLKILPEPNFDNFNDKFIYQLFSSLAALCDPLTQPSETGENNEFILSLDMVSDLVIALNLPKQLENKSPLPFFDMSLQLSIIVEKILFKLNCLDEILLSKIENDEENWLNNLKYWIPDNTLSSPSNLSNNYHDLKLLYSITCVSLLCIYKLTNKNLCLNPFLSFFLKIWKLQTLVVLLGLEIDRRDEKENLRGYPLIIRYVVKGSSAIRNVCAMILNNDLDTRIHDIKHESLNNFMSPWGRKAGNGSLFADMRLYVAAMLALGGELIDVTSLLIDLEPDDKLDEDIKYMFDYEFEDQDSTEAIENGPLDEDGEYDLHPDCNCEFEESEYRDCDYEDQDDENEYLHEYDNNDKALDFLPQSNGLITKIVDKNGKVFLKFLDKDNNEFIYDPENGDLMDNKNKEKINQEELLIKSNPIMNRNNFPTAFRSKIEEADDNDDSDGKDWRDVPRGDNIFFTDEFVNIIEKDDDDGKILIKNWSDMKSIFIEMTKKSISEEKGKTLILSVANVVKQEFDEQMKLARLGSEARLKHEQKIAQQKKGENICSPDTIYEFLSSNWTFESMINFNPAISFCIIDELLMAHGYRRVLIWFLTHLELSHWLINYIHELLVGIRGNTGNSAFPFSRKGPLVLSKVEKSMLLHEFISNAVVFIARGSGLETDLLQENYDNEQEEDVSVFGSHYRTIAKPSQARKLAKIICLMIKSLYDKKILIEKDEEYRPELQTLLIQWVCILPEAKQLFMRC